MTIDSEAYQLIQNSIQKLKLNLEGKTVLTEIGSGAFMYIGLIAALAGAKKLILWTKDSSYGAANDIIKDFTVHYKAWNLKTEFIISKNSRPISDIQEADIITNSGFIRPIDSGFINQIKPSAVIAYMAEAWEFRASDINLNYCHQKNILVGGTWENHPNLNIFDNCGPLALKMMADAGQDITNKNIAIVSNDHFGAVISKALKGIAHSIINTAQLNQINFSSFNLIFIADYSTENTILGSDGLLPIDKIQHCPVVHLAGKVDVVFAEKNRIKVWPAKNGASKKMTFTLAYLGIKPVIDLHTAGLKVGELMHNNQTSDLVQIM